MEENLGIFANRLPTARHVSEVILNHPAPTKLPAERHSTSEPRQDQHMCPTKSTPSYL